MEKDEFREVLSVYRDLGDTMKRIELLLGKIGNNTSDTKESISELNKHFRNGFKNDIINKVCDKFDDSFPSCIRMHVRELNLLFYRLIASSTVIVLIVSLIIYLVTGGKVKLPF